MKAIILLSLAVVLTSGCVCCGTDVFNGGEVSTTDTLEPKAAETTLPQMDSTYTATTPQETVSTTLAEDETSLTPSDEDTTQSTLAETGNQGIMECLGKKNINADEVVFLYTTSCCATLSNTVGQLGSYNFRKYELGRTITSDEKYVLECLGLDMNEMKGMQAGQFWCPASGEQLVIEKTEFIGAKDRIREFAISCRQKTLENE